MHNTLLQANSLLDIDWHSFLMGSEKWSFLPEVAIRSFVMFLSILISLRILGKRSVTQLSVFELGVIIGLGSAAGDPMFYKDVGLLPGILVFIVVISLYRMMTFVINKNEKIEKILEGEAVYFIEGGRFMIQNFKKETIAHDEFFSLLRQHNVAHLGQVQHAIIETNGTISLFYFPDEDVRWGLPVLPHLCDTKLKKLHQPGHYACSYCGQVEEITSSDVPDLCKVCGKDVWTVAINSKRIS